MTPESPENPENPDPTSPVLLRARGLTKTFGSFTAVDGIDVDVAKGESFGFLGPNGAGKSSTMKMVAATSPPTSGELTIFGLDPRVDGAAIRARLGNCPQQDNLDEEITVEENLHVYGRYFGLPRDVIRARTEELLDFAQLTERRRDRVEPLSGGMKRRLTIARSLINNPEILLLDEPTTGLDPQARHVLWDRLFRLKRQGVTLIITTHYMDEAEQLCDRLVVMDHGRIVAEGSPRALITQHATREVLELRLPLADQSGPAVLSGRGVPVDHTEIAHLVEGIGERVEALPDRLLLYTDHGDGALEAVHARGLTPISAIVRRSTLEDVFLHLTGRTLVD